MKKRARTYGAAILPFAWAAVSFLFPAPRLSAQSLAREALASFPADTEQLVYTDLEDLRRLPHYERMRRRTFGRQFGGFEEFLQMAGVDPEKDVDAVAMAWRRRRSGTKGPETTGFVGLAEGRFEPNRLKTFFTQHSLPLDEYRGQDIFAFGSGLSSSDVLFTFLGPSTAAFGRRSDLEALLDVRAEIRPALDSIPAFADAEEELAGTGSQWGVTTGKSVTGGAAWIPAPIRSSGLRSVLAPAETVLYRVNWRDDFSVDFSLLCRDRDGAKALATLLTTWRDALAGLTRSSGGIAGFSVLDVSTNEKRVEVSLSGPLDLVDSVIH